MINLKMKSQGGKYLESAIINHPNTTGTNYVDYTFTRFHWIIGVMVQPITTTFNIIRELTS